MVPEFVVVAIMAAGSPDMGGAVVVDAGAGADIAGGVGAAAAAAGGACDDGGGGGVDDPQPMTMQVGAVETVREVDWHIR